MSNLNGNLYVNAGSKKITGRYSFHSRDGGSVLIECRPCVAGAGGADDEAGYKAKRLSGNFSLPPNSGLTELSLKLPMCHRSCVPDGSGFEVPEPQIDLVGTGNVVIEIQPLHLNFVDAFSAATVR